MERRQNGGTFGDGSNYGGYDGYGDLNDGGEYDSWWWSPSGMAVRYAVIALLFGALALFLLFSYWHAKRRIRRGLAPLRYHRWMVRRDLQRAQMGYPHYRTGSGNNYRYPMPQNGQGYRQSQQGAAQTGYGYPMESYAPPPPAYNVNEAPPPVYQPPEGASKVAADQQGYVHVAPLPPTPGEAAGEGSSSPPGVRY